MTTHQDRVVVFTPPVEIDQTCRHCDEPLAATKGYRKASRDHLAWTHARTGEQICRLPVRRAEPRDAWRAIRQVNAALHGRVWAAERALDEALDLAGDQS